MPDLELRNMDGILEELEEAKAVVEKLRAECNMKGELSENLRRVNSEQFAKLQEANLKIENQAQELCEKAEELAMEKKRCEEFEQILTERESVIKHLTSANDKLRAGGDEKFLKLEEEMRSLGLALDDANEKCTHQDQKIHAYKEEIEGLKMSLSLLQRKCSDAEERSMAQKELTERDDALTDLNDENAKVRDKLKWKTEQFKHLEEALEKVRDQFKVNKEEWELEKATLLDEISSLQTRLDSQILISKNFQDKLEMCNQALAHEESRRKHLQVQITDFQTRFENVYDESEHTKAQLDDMTAQRDKEIAALRCSLSMKDSYLKEREYQTAKLEQENQELLKAIKELQETQVQAGALSSFKKLQSKLKSLETAHDECTSDLWAKEVEWTSQMEAILSELNDCKSELSRREATIKDFEAILEDHYSAAMQLKLQNEEFSAILLILNQGVSEAQMKLGKEMAEVDKHVNDREEKISLLMEKLDVVEEQLHLKQNELENYKEMLQEASKLHLMEQAMQTETGATEKLIEVCHALDGANAELPERESECERVQSLELIEEQYKLMLKVLDEYKEMFEESNKDHLQLKEQVLQIECDARQRIREASIALEEASSELADKICEGNQIDFEMHIWKSIAERLKVDLEENLGYKEMFEESNKDHLQLKKRVLQIECDARERIQEASIALEEVSAELADKICEGNQIDFEMHMWKSIAERLKVDLEENHDMRRELEASLLAEIQIGEIIKQEKYCLTQILKEKDRRIESLEQQVMLLEQGLEIIELEATTLAGTDSAISFESVRESFLQTIREKDEILERLQNEVECLEQDSLRRELEVAVLSQLGAERMFEREKDKLIQMVETKNIRIDQLMQLVESLEQKFNSSLESFSSQLDEKQAEISLVHQAWEKINAAEILAVLETEEKKLMILELEDSIRAIQQKLELQELSLDHAKEKAMNIEADLEAKESEMKKLTYHMKTKLTHSDALIDELKSEKSNLIEDVMKLSSEKEDLMGIIGGIGNHISEFSNSDKELMGLLEKIMLSFGNECQRVELKCDDELSFSKSNVSSPTVKRIDVSTETRSPFRELNG